MPLPGSGPISLLNLQNEFGGSSPISLSEYYKGGSFNTEGSTAPNVPRSGTISLGNFHGAGAYVAPTTPVWVPANAKIHVDFPNHRYWANGVTYEASANGALSLFPYNDNQMIRQINTGPKAGLQNGYSNGQGGILLNPSVFSALNMGNGGTIVVTVENWLTPTYEWTYPYYSSWDFTGIATGGVPGRTGTWIGALYTDPSWSGVMHETTGEKHEVQTGNSAEGLRKFAATLTKAKVSGSQNGAAYVTLAHPITAVWNSFSLYLPPGPVIKTYTYYNEVADSALPGMSTP